MSQYTLYYLYKKQRRPSGSTDDSAWQDVHPNEFSYDGDGTMEPHLIEDNAPSCGFVQEAMFEWRQMDPSIYYYCDGVDKYYQEQRYVSYSGGLFWQPLNEFRKGSLFESNSNVCGGGITIYRWVADGDSYVCVGMDKHQRLKQQVSYDSGNSWTDVNPPQYTTGVTIEYNSVDCGHEPPTQYRWAVSGTVCDGYDLYQQEVYQQSTDGGMNWENVEPIQTRQGSLIEENSVDCGYTPTGDTPIYEWRNMDINDDYNCADCPNVTSLEWVEDGTVCNGYSLYDKYKLSYRVVDSNSDVSIVDVIPEQYKYEMTDYYNNLYSKSCGFTGLTGNFKAKFTNSQGVHTIECNDSAVLESSDLTTYVEEDGSVLQVIGPDDVTSVEIGDCTKVIFDRCFANSPNLTSVTISDSVTTIGESAFGGAYLSYSGACKLTKVTIPNSVNEIGKYCFEYNSGITEVIIGNSVKKIPEGCFADSSIEKITIPSNVEIIGDGAFSNNTKNLDITIENGVKYIDRMAFMRSKINSIVIPDSVIEIGSGAFSGAGINVQTTEIEDIKLPSSITYIPYNFCYRCVNLKSIDIPYGVLTIDFGAFSHCSSLSSVTIPNSVISIGEYAFTECSNLTSITIPDSVRVISDSAFDGCKISNMTIGSGVTYIGGYNLSPESNPLTTLTIKAVTPPTFENVERLNYSTTVYVPAQSVDAYKKAWPENAELIQPIP